MDRRMLLAMLLAVGVLVLNSLLFGTKKRPREGAPVASDTSEVASPAPPRNTVSQPGGQEVSPTRAAAGATILRDSRAADTTGIVLVETDLVRAELILWVERSDPGS